MASETGPREEAVPVPSSTRGTTSPLAPILEDIAAGISTTDTLGRVLCGVMAWDLTNPDLDNYFSTLLSQAEIRLFDDLVEFAEYSYDDYREMYGVSFCLDYVDQIVDMKVLSTLYKELQSSGESLLDPTTIRQTTYNRRRRQARTQAVTEFRQVLKVPETLFATLRASGTPVKKHLMNNAFLGQTDEAGSLGDETYVTVQESPPDGTREPRDPLRNTMPLPTERISTAPMATGSAMEPPVGGTSTPIRDSPLQGGSFRDYARASTREQYAFSGPHAPRNDEERRRERDDMERQSEILFNSLQRLTGSDPRGRKGPVTRTAISSKVTWNGAKDTCKDFKNMIEGHLNQCGMAYAHDETFLKEYKLGGWIAARELAWQHDPTLTEDQVRRDSLHLFGMLQSVCRKAVSAQRFFIQPSKKQDGFIAYNDILEWYLKGADTNMYINRLKASLNVAYSDRSSGGVINFLEKIQGAYADYDHAIQQYGDGQFHLDSDKERIIHVTSLFQHSDENKMVYEECRNAIRQGKSFADYICDLRDLYSYTTDAEASKARRHARKAETTMDGLISDLVQANLGQRDELFIPRKALQLLDAIHPGIRQQYLKQKEMMIQRESLQ